MTCPEVGGLLLSVPEGVLQPEAGQDPDAGHCSLHTRPVPGHTAVLRNISSLLSFKQEEVQSKKLYFRKIRLSSLCSMIWSLRIIKQGPVEIYHLSSGHKGVMFIISYHTFEKNDFIKACPA